MFVRRAAVPVLILAWLGVGRLPAQQVPRPSTDLVINMVGGKPIHLSDYKGKPIVLACILTTCSHCQHTVTQLNKLQGEFAPRGVQILAAAAEASPELSVPLFVKELHPPFPVGYIMDTMGVLSYFQYSASNMPNMPILAFIDRQFVIRAQYNGKDTNFFAPDPQGETNLRNQIGSLLKQIAPKK
jgi:thiol-disulfide isomerase/thioredoxin